VNGTVSKGGRSFRIDDHSPGTPPEMATAAPLIGIAAYPQSATIGVRNCPNTYQ
jgi:hypothetical protein